MRVERSPTEVADIIQQFLDGTGGKWDWDDFISTPLCDSRLDEVRKLCGNLPNRFPPHGSGVYCDADGLAVLRNLVAELSSTNNQ
jgi:hypothetical protein